MRDFGVSRHNAFHATAYQEKRKIMMAATTHTEREPYPNNNNTDDAQPIHEHRFTNVNTYIFNGVRIYVCESCPFLTSDAPKALYRYNR